MKRPNSQFTIKEFVRTINKLTASIEKIANESVLQKEEAFEIFKKMGLPFYFYDFFTEKIIELANKGETKEIIVVQLCSLMCQICVCGGLQNYQTMLNKQ